jgi:hypothetical protein
MWNTSKIVGDDFWVHLQTSFVDFGIKWMKSKILNIESYDPLFFPI